jgi:hypothetical protein
MIAQQQSLSVEMHHCTWCVSDSVIVVFDDGQDGDIDWKKLLMTQSQTNIHYRQNCGHRSGLHFQLRQLGILFFTAPVNAGRQACMAITLQDNADPRD